MKTSILFLLLLAAFNAPAENLGRLFFTPAQRAELDALQQRETRTSLTLNGIVQRQQTRTVWINGVARNIAQNDAHLATRLTLPSSSVKLTLKVGETLSLPTTLP